MKAVVFQGPFKLSVENVDDPKIEEPGDAVIRITTANICGSDLHAHELPLDEAPAAYEQFDKRANGWTKVILHPGRHA